VKLLVVSICHNESKTIGEVLDRIPDDIPGISKIDKLVIDDGSSDDTAKVAKEHGARVINDGNQKRLAFRFREAVKEALATHTDVMVNIDGDLQFQPEDIPKLVEPIIEDKADFVAADRFSNPGNGKFVRPKNMQLGKYVGNRIGAKVVSKLSKDVFHDVTCGFRAYNRRTLFALNTDGIHTYTQESFQVLAMKRFRIEQIPINVKYFPERKSRVVKSIFGYVATSAVSILRAYRDFAPLRFFGWLGFIPFSVGLISTAIFLIHYLFTGHFSPYKFLGFSGVYFITLAIILWALGLVADMLSRMLNNQEKILAETKEIKYDKK
jgi:glycosyltransferase involved in cell wall biosynthesis